MSDQPDPNLEKKAVRPKDRTGNLNVLLFVIILCFVSSLLLAVIAFSLKNPQEEAKELDRSKQMLIAAKILNHAGYFEILKEDGQTTPARYDESSKELVALQGEIPPLATPEQIKKISEERIRALLTNEKGEIFTFKEKNLDLSEYLSENKKIGYSKLPFKLFYIILKNGTKEKPSEDVKEFKEVYGYVFPVSGFGLWAPIYGYIAVDKNGDNVIGTTWYEHAETPGLGANIVEAWWQNQFYGKVIFQQQPSGQTDFQTAPMGIVVVKGKVKDVYGNSPKSKSAVDGMSGATLTGDGVTAAYQDSLSPYRALLIKIHENQLNHSPQKEQSNG